MFDPNTPNKPNRRLVHHRQIDAKSYKRDDGLWDLEAEMTDLKGADFQLAVMLRRQGEPIHKMRLSVTINEEMDILACQVQFLGVPYPGYCEQIEPSYQQLVGLNLQRGFRAAVKERLGGLQGCTHVSELTNVLPTVAFQGFVNEIPASSLEYDPQTNPEKIIPPQFNGCHSLNTEWEVVRQYHPTWYQHSAGTKDNPSE